MPRKKLSNYFQNIFKLLAHWLLIAIVPIILVTLIVFPFVVKVKSVTCSTQYGTCSEKLNEQLKSSLGKSIFITKRDLKRILAKNLLIKIYTVRYLFPDTLDINVVVKKPSFCLLHGPNQYFLIDQEGLILDTQQSCSLPSVQGSVANYSIGQKVSDKDLFTLKIAQGVYEMYQVRILKSSNDNLTVDLPSGVKVIFPTGGDADLLLGALRLIYTKVQGQSPGKYKEIDLRFESPVLR